MAAMGTDRVLSWFWFWFGLTFCGVDRVLTWPGLGQHCDGRTGGRCDGNLSCVPDYESPDEEAGGGICVQVPRRAYCVPCAEVKCPLEDWICPSDYTTDPCGCCKHCGRRRGQVCGGPHWELGYCDRHLTCALFLGNAPATPPATGVCKALPGFRTYGQADKQCPWKWGCNKRMGTCDCYGIQTCRTSPFAYNTHQECQKVMDEDFEYENRMLSKLDGGEDEVVEKKVRLCTTYGCVVQEEGCVCLHRPCGSQPPPLSRNKCENQLRLMKCANVSCPVVPDPPCPLDSFLTKPYTPLRQCCPRLPALCTCAFERCPTKPRDCPPGQRAHIVTRGSGRPGDCCDRYLCIPEEEKSAAENRDEEVE